MGWCSGPQVFVTACVPVVPSPFKMEETDIPWSRVAAFVRQHTHDVRNGLNSLDLETEFLHELVPVGEASESVQRIRKQLRSVAQQLRTLSALFQEPSPLAAKIPARILLKIWKEKHAALSPMPQVRWVDELGAEQVSVDVEMIAVVFRELLTNATLYSAGAALTITARTQGNDVMFELVEPKKAPADPATWGQPLVSTRRDRYGLGLWTARRLMELNGASLTQRYIPEESCLKTQIALPVV